MSVEFNEYAKRALITAMQNERERVIDKITSGSVTSYDDYKFYVGSIKGIDVAIQSIKDVFTEVNAEE